MEIKIEDKTLNKEDVGQNQWQSFSFENTLNTLDNSGNVHDRLKQNILKQYPKLNTIWEQLCVDGYSKLENIRPFLVDLASLPEETLNKVKMYNNLICISDRPVTIRSTNKDLRWTPRGWSKWSSRNNVWWIYRREQKTLYIWRSNVNWRLIAQESTTLHELWHMFDYESMWWDEIVSQTAKFKNFHKLFYDKLTSYYQQWGPWWKTWCKEFFAELCYEFFKWGKENFSKYYNQDLYDYMKTILI